VVGFSKSLAIELGRDQIRVNAICPGAVEGPRIDRVIAAKAEARGVSFEAMRAEYVAQASMRTLIPPQDIANMIVYLCSDLGRTVSGQVIGIDGNIEALR
jgi:NAD(P)-dependent dehydrogenase (short-subunit alcohol dehydrogenase family)